jgi:aspartate aminotransferase
MMSIENSRSRDVKSSPSMVISMAAGRMRAAGEDVIDLSLGEPDFETPTHIVEAAMEAMRSGDTRYTGPQGSAALREAIVAKFARDNALEYSASEIAVGNGAKQIVFNAFLATLEAGDEVVIPAPCWVSYVDIVQLHGGSPVVIHCPPEEGFKLSPDSLASRITPRTRWLLLNSPANPSGAIYSQAEYTALAGVLEQHDNILVMCDEIYEHIVLDDRPFISFASACPQLRNRTLLVNGVSKAYAMTGWRLGYAAGPQPLIDALNKMQSQSTTCPSSISQAAAVAALAGPQSFVGKSRRRYAARRQQLASDIAAIDGLALTLPDGAFYLFPECSAFIGRRTPCGIPIVSDADLAGYLLADAKVATVPGVAFGMQPFLRLSFAASSESLAAAARRIAGSLAKIEASSETARSGDA